MGCKTPIFFNLRKYVEKHCKSSEWVHSKMRKQGKPQQRLHCSWFDWLLWQWLKGDQNADWKKKHW